MPESIKPTSASQAPFSERHGNADTATPKANGAAEAPDKRKQLPISRAESNKSKALLSRMLETYALVIAGNDVRIFWWHGSELKMLVTGAFRTFYSNRKILIANEKGEEVAVPVAEIFMSKAIRCMGLGFDPNDGPIIYKTGSDAFNMWRGWGVPPKQGDWSLMQAHIRNVLAAGDTASYTYILKWAAWAVQNPARQSEVALVFRGGQGTGKGTFGRALKDVFGAHGLHISLPEHLVGKFNRHLAYCSLLFADEAFWAGDKKNLGRFKALITEPEISIEPKRVDTLNVPNRLHIVIASNEDWVVPAGYDERRFAVFNVSEDRKGDHAYFDALHAEMRNGGLAAMLYDLLHMDLGDWHPRLDVPQTEALQNQKMLSLSGIDELVFAMLTDRDWPRVSGHPNVARTNGFEVGLGLWGWAKKHASGLRYANPRKMAPDLKKHWGFKKFKSGPNRGIQPPSASALRQRFEKKYGPQDWDDETEWEDDRPTTEEED